MHNESTFYKAMMTGLFVGIIDTLICLGYNIGYRDMTGYLPSAFINVSSLIFIVNLLLLVIGIVYFGFVKAFGNKDVIFILAILSLTAWCLWKVETGHRFDDAHLNAGFHGLLSGIILICGLSAATIPFLYHSKGFEKHVL
jgi:uncharacterized membrane-anchored protein YitT (DUF2179 family)